MYNLHKKTFVTAANPQGLSSDKTIFSYEQKGEVLTGKYSGGPIEEGQLIGKINSSNEIELLYHCLTNTGELKSGWSKGTVSKNSRGQLVINLDWAWLTGDQSGGQSSYLEYTDH